MTWSMVLIYLVIGASYRLSLMGAFTAPVASALLFFAMALSRGEPAARKIKVNPWLEAHTSFSMVACGAFALACIAGVMFLIQERQLKTRQPDLNFLSITPDQRLVGGKFTSVVARFRSFYGWAGNGIFDWWSHQLGTSCLVDLGLVRLRRYPGGPNTACHGRKVGGNPVDHRI